MKKKMPVTTNYEELMSQRYGKLHKDHAKKGHARGYGSAHGYRAGHGYGYGHGADAPPLVLSKSFDDGELLSQKDGPFAEYVVQSSVTGSGVTGSSGEAEYVVGNCDEMSPRGANGWPAASAMSWTAAADMNTLRNQGSGQGPEDIQYEMIPPGMPGSSNARQEWQVDLLRPLQGSGQAVYPAGMAGSAFGGSPAPPDAFFASSASAEPYPDMPAEESRKTKASDEDFMADMQSILMGQKVFDPVTRSTVDKDQLARSSSTRSSSYNNSGGTGVGGGAWGGSGAGGAGQKNLPVPDGPGEHAIFEKIAQSMQYANAYDLGTVELENRFADFDKLTDQKDNEAMTKKTAPPKSGPLYAPSSSSPAAYGTGSSSSPGSTSLSFEELKVGNEDFLRDLDAIRDLEALRQPDAQSSQPTQSPQPTQSSQPTQSPQPAQSLQPDQSAQPAQSAHSAQSAQPAQTAQSAQADRPDPPGPPGYPEKQ